MTVRTMPKINAFERMERLEADCPAPEALDRWDIGQRISAAGEGTVIEINDIIGEDPWFGGGFSLKDLKSALAASSGPVTVNINSPGGDYFEGLAMYNTLREHPARVKVNVMALAASAASIVMMAGDQIRIAKAGFVMIHNCWGLVIGNAADFTSAAAVFEKFDDGASIVYAARTGTDKTALRAMMSADNGRGTWLSGEQAVEDGFADALLPSDAVSADVAARAAHEPVMALRRVDAILARQGKTKSERRKMLNEIKSGKSGAVAPAMHDAGLKGVADDLRRLVETLR
jgi:ATP-dependent Clp protease protease subunit